MAQWGRCYSIVVVVGSSLAILMCSDLIYTGYERLLPEHLSNIQRVSDVKAMSQDEKMHVATDNTVPSLSNRTTKRKWPSFSISSIKHSTRGLNLNTVSGKEDVKMSLTLSNMHLPKYENSFKNPCWYDWYDEVTTFRCFPYAYLAGFPKCGTTDLYHRLVAHPLAVAGSRKGTHYFTRSYFNTTLENCTSHFDCASVTFSSKYFTRASQMVSMTNDMNLMTSTFVESGKVNRPSFNQIDFIKAFPSESAAIWKEGQKFIKYPGIIVDGSPSTSWDHHNFIHFTENQDYGFPRNFSADWIRKIYPDTKIILILREPVSRAYSDYTMYNPLLRIEIFHREVKQTIQQIEQCLQSETHELLCTTYTYKARLQAGLYYFYINAWFEKFPRDQILILRYEDYVTSIPETLQKVFHFLGLPAVSNEGLAFMSKSDIMNASKVKRKPVMLEQTKDLLTKFYKPFNEKLASLLGDNRFLWS